jgi:hypothetical protein
MKHCAVKASEILTTFCDVTGCSVVVLDPAVAAAAVTVEVGITLGVAVSVTSRVVPVVVATADKNDCFSFKIMLARKISVIL